MRAYEILENYDPPSKPLTLRALHHLKREKKAREIYDLERQSIVGIMYSSPASQQKKIDLKRKRLESDQIRAGIANTEAETSMVLHSNAKSGIAAMDKNQQKLTKLANNWLGRRKKA